jgi:hypothetical protein
MRQAPVERVSHYRTAQLARAQAIRLSGWFLAASGGVVFGSFATLYVDPVDHRREVLREIATIGTVAGALFKFVVFGSLGLLVVSISVPRIDAGYDRLLRSRLLAHINGWSTSALAASPVIRRA